MIKVPYNVEDSWSSYLNTYITIMLCCTLLADLTGKLSYDSGRLIDRTHWQQTSLGMYISFRSCSFFDCFLNNMSSGLHPNGGIFNAIEQAGGGRICRVTQSDRSCRPFRALA